MSIVRTQKEVAEALGITERRVRQLKKAGMPGEPGRYDLRAINEWREERIPKKTIGEVNLLLQNERYLHEQAKRKAKERENDIAAGRLMDIDEIKRINLEVDAAIKSDLLAIPSSIAPFLEGLTAREIHKKLEEAIYDALRHIAGRAI